MLRCRRRCSSFLLLLLLLLDEFYFCLCNGIEPPLPHLACGGNQHEGATLPEQLQHAIRS
jgi:hypothetical protein